MARTASTTATAGGSRRSMSAMVPRAARLPGVTSPTEIARASDPLAAAIAARLPELRLLTDPGDRESYRPDETPYLAAGLPGAVALPTTTAAGRRARPDLRRARRPDRAARRRHRAVRRRCRHRRRSDDRLHARWTGSSRSTATNLVTVVQPGIINARLKAAVAEDGLFYAPDPASYEMCSIGGNLGTNAGGLCCVKYGQTRESVLSLEVVMADGTVIRTGGKNVKDVAGYSLTHLFVGSQGTLAIITEATLRLRPAPPPAVHDAGLLPDPRRRRRRGRRDRRRGDHRRSRSS